jgi:hypothetical protein
MYLSASHNLSPDHARVARRSDWTKSAHTRSQSRRLGYRLAGASPSAPTATELVKRTAAALSASCRSAISSSTDRMRWNASLAARHSLRSPRTTPSTLILTPTTAVRSKTMFAPVAHAASSPPTARGVFSGELNPDPESAAADLRRGGAERPMCQCHADGFF